MLDLPCFNTTKVNHQVNFENILLSVSILLLHNAKFWHVVSLRKNEAQNSKNDRNLPISAIFDMPYFNTTKVSHQVNFENILYSVSFLLLHMQNLGMLYHSGKMKLEMQRRPNLPILAILDLPYLDTTIVGPSLIKPKPIAMIDNCHKLSILRLFVCN